MWRKYLFLIGLAVLAGSFSACQAPVGDNELTQISTIDALLAGDYDGTMTVRELKRFGNFGLGTYAGLDGELIAWNGEYFRADVDGNVWQAADNQKVPFAAVTRFKADRHFQAADASDFDSVKKQIDQHIKSQNVFYAIALRGRFERLRIRSVPKQSPPYRPMAEFVGKEQRIFELSDAEGIVLGFRSPAYVSGLGVPGYHLHFISENKKNGGHVLDFQLGQGLVETAEIRTLRVVLPRSESFDAAALETDRSHELAAVER